MFIVLLIFKWVLLTSVMASVLVGIILFAKIVFKGRLSAKWHYYLWFLLLLRLLVPYAPESAASIYNVVSPITDSITSRVNNNFTNIETSDYKNDSQKERAASISSNQALDQKTEKRNYTVNTIQKDFIGWFDPSNYTKLLMAIWLIGVFLFALYIIFINLKLIWQINKKSEACNDTVKDIFDECRKVMNIHGNFPVLFSEAIHAPALCGLIMPRLLLPKGLQGNLSSEEIKYIFLHELAHLKRNDNIINWVAVILKVIHWFNPLIWYGFYKMRQDCEVACDALALSYVMPEERKEYGYTIIHLIKMISRPQWIPGATGILEGKFQMKKRITLISLFRKESLQWTIIGIILFTAMGFVGLTNARHDKELNLSKQQAALENASLIRSNNEKESMYRELDSKYNELQKELQSSRIMAGTVDIEGRGIRVTLADGKMELPKKDPWPSEIFSLVHDSDIIKIVNELSSAGAEAISVNDDRLIATSEIKANVINGSSYSSPVNEILINGNRYSSPFVIKAIGNPEAMESALNREGGIAYYLKVYQVGFKIEKADKLFISRFKGKKDFKYAQPVESNIKPDDEKLEKEKSLGDKIIYGDVQVGIQDEWAPQE